MNKTKFQTIFMLLALCAATSGYAQSLQKSGNSVTIEQGDDTLIKLEVYDEAIVKVTKEVKGTPESVIPDYVVTLEPQEVEWSAKSEGGSTILTTPKIEVRVDREGVITFSDREGNLLLSETGDYSINPEGEYKVMQSFVAGDEALYGLGQYQSGIMDWRGVSVRMRQYNQEIVVPFLVSTKGYGIHWDNYSVTDFNPAEHELLFEDKDINLAAVEDNSDINAEDVANSKRERVHDRNNNKQETTFIPAKSGLYTFFVVADNPGGRRDSDIQLVISGDTIINYSTTWTPQCYSAVKELKAGEECSILFNNTGAPIPGNVYYNEPDYNKTAFASLEGDRVKYFFIGSGDMIEAIALNTKLSGGTPMLDMKSYGFWQCRERYHNQAEILENANELRKREIPVDVIVQDWFYWPKGTKGPEWDREKYPDPAAMASELKDLNLNLLVSVWPTVTNDPLLKKYDLYDKQIGRGYLDFYNEEVYDRYYRMLSDSMFHFGVSGIWLDGSEPEASESLRGKRTAIGKEFSHVCNPYSLLVNGSMYDGQRKEFPDRRVMNLTRSGYLGQQRYGAVIWSGDVAGTWEQFAEQIPAGLNITVAGLNYWTHDIGGFFRDSKSMNRIYDSQYTNPEYIELLTRWFQFGTFSPIFRIHGYVSQTEIWRYNDAFEATARKFIDLRYKLLPYIYSQAWRVTRDGHTIMAPLAYYYPEDKLTWQIKDQYFFGENIMVAFVTEYLEREKELYLPQGEWYDFWSDEKIQGGKCMVADAPLDSTPIYIKAGAVMPYGPKIQHADDESDEPLEIKVYPGKDGEYTLYLDDKRSYDYQSGEYTELRFSYNDTKRTLTVETLTDGWRNFKSEPLKLKVTVAGETISKDVTYSGKKSSIKLK